jgi:hypothetical protein
VEIKMLKFISIAAAGALTVAVFATAPTGSEAIAAPKTKPGTPGRVTGIAADPADPSGASGKRKKQFKGRTPKRGGTALPSVTDLVIDSFNKPASRPSQRRKR